MSDSGLTQRDGIMRDASSRAQEMHEPFVLPDAPESADLISLKVDQPALPTDEPMQADSSLSAGSSRSAPALVTSVIGSSESKPIPAVAVPTRPVDDATIITRRPPELPGANRALAPLELGKLLIGQRLNHFELLEFVGGGGMGAVFRARDTMLNREVALKVLSRDQSSDDETRRRFQNEAQSAARLDHENIARVYYVGEDRGLNYIVFEFIEGTNLRDLVDQHGGPLPLAEAISYTLQIAKALDHAAGRDVVHRDIKPSNVLITKEGRAKLVDMGLARLHQVDSRDDLTASGVTLGTFDYISPEQARDPRSADVRSDIYSLGCTLYFMLTARPPFPEGTVLQKLLQHNSDEPTDPQQFNPDVNDEVAALLKRMLAKTPKRRYQTPRELIDDLLRLADAIGLSVGVLGLSVSSGSTNVTAWWARHLPWAVPVMVLLAVVFAMEWYSGSAADSAIDVTNNSYIERNVPGATTSAQSSTIAPMITANETLDDRLLKSSDRTSSVRSSGSLNAGTLPNSTTSGGLSDAAGLPTNLTTSSGMTSNAVTGPSANPMPGNGMGSTGANAIGISGKDGAQSDGTLNRGKSTKTDLIESPAVEGPLRPGLLVVSPIARGPQYYASLRAACSAAKNGDVIELRFNGPRDERPIVVNNRRFTIRAGESYQPVVVFRPNEPDPLRYPRSMITVVGGRLSLVNLSIELHVPLPNDLPAERWSLLETQHCESIELQTCTLTIRNSIDQSALHPATAFFQVRGAPGFDSQMLPDDPVEPVHLHLENCIVRGEASLLRSDDLQPVQLTWDNGLFTTTEWLAVVYGAESSGRHEQHIRLALRHVTAALGSGFCRMVNGLDEPYLPQVDVQCADSILAAPTTAALIDQEGIDDLTTFRNYLTWNSERVFYQGFDTSSLWRILDLNRNDGVQSASLAEWETTWGPQHEILPAWGDISWRHSQPTTPMWQRTVEDYALGDASAENMARNGASDGRDVGLLAYLLPR